MRKLLQTLTLVASAAIAFTVTIPVGTQAAGANAIVTVHAVSPFGSAPGVSGLTPSSPYVSIVSDAGADLSGSASGTLSCGSNATAQSDPGSYAIMSCGGFSVPGYNVVYNTDNSTFTILHNSVVFGLINRFLPPGSTVELNPQPFPPGAAIDIQWKAKKQCNGSAANPGVVAMPLMNGQQITSEGPIVVPCQAHKNGSPAGAAQGARASNMTYGVNDYCLWTDASGQIHHYLSFLPSGCHIQHTVSIFDSSIDSGANLDMSKGHFTGATLVTENPMPVFGGSYSPASGAATLDVGDDDFCGSTGTIPLPFPPKCVGSTIYVSGVTPSVYNGAFKITGATAGTIVYQLKQAPPAGTEPSGGSFQFGHVQLGMPSGSNMANVVLQDTRTGNF